VGVPRVRARALVDQGLVDAIAASLTLTLSQGERE
jgi:hypothetical protein